MSSEKSATSIIDDVLDSALGGLAWVRSFLLGQFEPEKELSVVIAEALASFVPGVVIVFSARDAVAITIRLANHPEKRDDLLEWIYLCACLIVIALPAVMAVAGVALAGVGAIVGALAGTELGAALKAVILLLMSKGAKLADILLFLQKFMKGDLTGFLKQIKFMQFEKALQSTLKSTAAKLIEICTGLRQRLGPYSYFDEVSNTIATLSEWETKFYAVQSAAIKNMPRALAELDARLAVVLTQAGLKELQTATAGVRAAAPARPIIEPQRVYASVGHPSGHRTAPPAAGVQPNANPAVNPAIRNKADPLPIAVEGPNSKRQTTAEDLRVSGANASAVGDGLAFRADLQRHMIGPDGFTKSGQLSGTHNLDNAIAALNSRGATYTVNPTNTPGVSELQYTYTNPTTGKLVSGNKTVYDPVVLSDNTIMNSAQKAGRTAWAQYLQNSSVKIFDGMEGGVKFRSYINIDKNGNAFIGNVHPIK